MLAGALKKKPLTVKSATRLGDALALVKAEPFSCLLVDKNLEDGSGLDLIERARVLQPFCGCVMMTGYPNADSILRALRLGAVDYLEKPFPSLAIIQEKVMGVVERQRLLAERDTLYQRLQELTAHGDREAFQETAQLVMLQQALAVHQEDHARALLAQQERSDAAFNELNSRLDAVKFRHQRALSALRRTAASLANLLEGHQLQGPAEQELREVRRLVTSLLDEH